MNCNEYQRKEKCPIFIRIGLKLTQWQNIYRWFTCSIDCCLKYNKYLSVMLEWDLVTVLGCFFLGSLLLWRLSIAHSSYTTNVYKLDVYAHSSYTTNVYNLDVYAGSGSILSCTSVHLGCHVPADWPWFIKFPHH